MASQVYNFMSKLIFKLCHCILIIILGSQQIVPLLREMMMFKRQIKIITSKYLVWVQQQSGKNFIILKHIHSTELKSLLHKVLEELHYGYIFQNILVSIPRVKYLNKTSSGNLNYHLKLALNVPLFFVALYDVRLSCVKNLALSNY